MKPLYQDRDWLFSHYVDKQLYINDIARMCDVSHAAILKWLKKHDIDRRPQPRRSGILNPHWKGGEYISSQGYRFCMRKGHPRAINGGYVPEHILIVEAHIGRFLQEGETVHHIDFNRINNQLSNLYLFPTKQDHDRYHLALRRGLTQEITESNLSMNGQVISA